VRPSSGARRRRNKGVRDPRETSPVMPALVEVKLGNDRQRDVL